MCSVHNKIDLIFLQSGKTKKKKNDKNTIIYWKDAELNFLFVRQMVVLWTSMKIGVKVGKR